jgi:cobalt-zinc-cadmium efflux system protein
MRTFAGKSENTMAHEHHHHEHHHHIHVVPSSQSGIFIFCIILNLLFVGIEALIGLTQNSLSLLSDAGHNLSDVFSLLLVLIAFRLAKVRAGQHYTYGLKKSTILISLLNAILLLVAIAGIVFESIHKFSEPADVNGMAVTWTAGAGILINGLTVLLLMRGQKNDINIRGAFLHMVADTLVSVGVVISGIIITYTGWNVIDPIVSLIIAGVILISTWELLTASLRLIVDGTPEGVEPHDIHQLLENAEHVTEVHHLHIWALSTTDNALTAHVVIDHLEHMETVKEQLKHHLSEHGITHSTLEFETPDSKCHEHCCEDCQS